MNKQERSTINASLFLLAFLIAFFVAEVFRGFPLLRWYFDLWIRSQFLAIGILTGVGILFRLMAEGFQPLFRESEARDVARGGRHTIDEILANLPAAGDARANALVSALRQHKQADVQQTILLKLSEMGERARSAVPQLLALNIGRPAMRV